jgi:hypothetical protein
MGYSFTKVGALFSDSSSARCYYPSMIDTRGVPNWPWTFTVFASTDHSSTGGIYMMGAVGDPRVAANWETYNSGLAAGRFAAFATKPSANPIYTDAMSGYSGTETPHVEKIGSTWYMTAQIGISGSNQPTILATSTDLLNWTNHARAGDSLPIILDGNLETEFPANDLHRGYFVWGPNPFPNLAGTYFGMGAHGAGGKSMTALRTSNDGISWTVQRLVNDHSSLTGALPDGWGVKFPEFDPHSVRDAGGGEYVMLAPCGSKASGSEDRFSALYEVYVLDDGKLTVSREPRLVIAQGGVGAADEYEIGQPCSLDYNGTLVLVYQGADSLQDNSLMLATGSYDGSAAKPAAVSRPNHNRYYFNQSDGVLPAWLENDGGTTNFQTGYFNIAASAGVRFNADIVPDTVQYMEVYITMVPGGGSTAVPYVLVSATRANSGTKNGVFFSAFSGTGEFLGCWVANVDGEVLNNAGGFTFEAGGQSHRRGRFGIRWDANLDRLTMLGASGHNHTIFSVPSAPGGMSLRPRVSFNTAAGRIESIEFRIATAGAGVAPTITSVTALPKQLDFTLSKDCAGDGTGITISDNGTPVTGVWSRNDLGQIRFRKSSGRFQGPITYTVGSTDIRSTDDLVAIKAVSDVAVEYVPPPAGDHGVVSDVSRPIVRSIVRSIAR